MKRYEEYSNSQISWMPRIPAHWEIKRGKSLYYQVKREPLDEDEVITCFRDGEVTLRKNRRTTGFTESIKEICYQRILNGDLVIHQMDAFAGAVGVSDSDGKASPVYSVCVPISEAINDYYAKVVRLMAKLGYIESLAKGIRERSTDFRFSTFAAQYLPVPPPEEQRQIARYLDHKHAQIERFIRNKRQLIALLQEQKQSRINTAVTKGLDPNAFMKASGIEWLGDIPAHWEVSPLKGVMLNLNYLREPISAADRGAEWEGKYDYYGASGVIDRYDDYIFDDTLLLIAEGGANLLMRNKPLLIKATGKFWVNNHAHILKPSSGNLDYWMHLLESYDYSIFITGAAQPKLSAGVLMRIKVTVPPLQEQQQIAAHLQKETHLIDTAIARAGHEIELMQEYRDRLVADVVTGQVDIRDVPVPDAPATTETPQPAAL